MNSLPTLPNPINGYIFAIIAFILEFVSLSTPNLDFLFYVIAILAWAYYLWNVHIIHKIVIISIDPSHEITPAKAVWFHLIPIYNAFWIYKWPKELLSIILFKTNDPGFRFGLTLGLIYTGLILARIDFAIGFAVFWTGFSMMARALRRLSETKLGSVSTPNNFNQESLNNQFTPPPK